MKNNSSKNRKANLPTVSNEKPQGVTEPSDDEDKKENSKNKRELNFFDELKKLDSEIYIHNVDMTKRLFDEQIKQFTKNQDDELKKYESMLMEQNLNQTDFITLMNAKKSQQNIDLGKQQQELYKTFGLTKKKTEGFTKTDKTIGKIDDFLEKFDGKVEKVLDKNNKALKGAWLGSLNLITAPLEDFFGFDTMNVLKMALGISSKTKKRPTASDVQKKGDAGALFINNTIEEIFGKNKKKKDKKSVMGHILETLNDRLLFLPKAIMSFAKGIPILGTALKGIGVLGKSFSKNALGKGGSIGKFLANGATKTALKAISPMAIITSIIMMVVDGIKGIFKAKEWGVPKGSAFLGGLFGGVEKGAKGAFKNMGKWALMGFGIGCIFTPIGGIVGGIIGGIFGAVLGAIGGERLSRLFTEFGNWVLKPFKEIGNIWKNEEGTVMQKIGKTLGKVIQGIITLPFKFYILAFKKIKNWFMSKKEMKKQEKEMKKKVKPNKNKSPITEFFKGFWDGATKSIKDFLKNPLLFNTKGMLLWTDKVMGWIWDGVSGLIQGIFGVETISWKDFKTQISDTIQRYVIDPMFRVFGIAKDFFDMLIHDPKLIGKAIIDKNFTMADAFEEYFAKKESKVEKVNDAIIKKDGTIIRTSQDDNLIATKNDPTKIMSMNDFNSDRLKDVVNSAKNIQQIDYSNQLGTMIDLLNKLLNKEVVTVNNNEQSLSDLKVLAGGFNVAY